MPIHTLNKCYGFDRYKKAVSEVIHFGATLSQPIYFVKNVCRSRFRISCSDFLALGTKVEVRLFLYAAFLQMRLAALDSRFVLQIGFLTTK